MYMVFKKKLFKLETTKIYISSFRHIYKRDNIYSNWEFTKLFA